MSDIREGLLDQLAAEGWDGLAPRAAGSDPQMMAMLAEAERESRLVSAALGTENGQRLLKWLLLKTIFAPPTEEETTTATAERYAILKARREGQNGVVWMLLQAMQMATVKPQGGL